MIRFCICFLIKGSQVLMLNRNKAPNKGLWNGVGGKLELDETPEQSVIREVSEETGYRISSPYYGGIVRWEVDDKEIGGMHVFIVNISDEVTYPTPEKMDEGILDWKELSWVLDEDNQGVVSNIRHFLPDMLQGKEASDYLCIYRDGRLSHVKEMRLGQMNFVQ
ncbi:NUDIX hydrolase [Pseudalkalibacillus sp. R45]|uniref:NUDIX hydrolase n=1 Tax=Pseudalkalibacillus sp. R45 TaxID=3457433 RepID=UPI003FCD2067